MEKQQENMMCYYITDGERYIFRNVQGKYVPVGNVSLADMFTRKTALNICNNRLPKALRKVFHVEKADLSKMNNSGDSGGSGSTDGSKNVKSDNMQKNFLENENQKRPEGHFSNNTQSIETGLKTITKAKVRSNASRVTEDENVKVWMERLVMMKDVPSDARKRKHELELQLNFVNKELEDLMHYMEFSNLNAVEGYKTYKVVHDKRQERRKIKDELTVITIISEQNLDDYDKSLENAIKRIRGLDKRLYEPRVLKNLFDFTESEDAENGSKKDE